MKWKRVTAAVIMATVGWIGSVRAEVMPLGIRLGTTTMAEIKLDRKIWPSAEFKVPGGGVAVWTGGSDWGVGKAKPWEAVGARTVCAVYDERGIVRSVYMEYMDGVEKEVRRRLDKKYIGSLLERNPDKWVAVVGKDTIFFKENFFGGAITIYSEREFYPKAMDILKEINRNLK